MGSWVGLAKKHNPNPKTKAQQRASDQGGKLADDHFQRLFLGGATKRAVATSTITAESGGVLGSGTATVYTITSDTVDGPPIQTSEVQTIYNPRTTSYSTNDVLVVVDTGRFFILMTKVT
jgi:hypothetical protein